MKHRYVATLALVGVLAFGASSATLAAPHGNAEFVPPDDAQLLTRLYTFLNVGNAEDEAGVFREEALAEDWLVPCMAEAGLDYRPNPPVPDPAQSTMAPEDYAAAYGFGIAESVGLAPDPNFDYVSGLSQGQRDAYYRALDSCRAEFSSGEQQAYSNAFSVALEQFRPAVDSDERVGEAVEVWRSCMEDAGFEYENPLAMRTSFYERLGSGSVDQDALRQEEVDVAVANVPCEQAYRDTFREVVTDRFGDFKDLLAAALEEGASPDNEG